MGWVIVALSVLIILSIISFFQGRKKKPAGNNIEDLGIYNQVLQACAESNSNSGQFEISLEELTNQAWLELDQHGLSIDQFDAVVKWRNKGNQCLYKIVATTGTDEESISRTSENYTANL